MLQTNLFGEIEPNLVSINDAAKIACVSTATIRNWIKTGYFIVGSKGHITQDSLSKFISEVVGKDKLNSRANKQQKDNHNHQDLSLDIAEQVISNIKNGESLWQLYENSLSESHRNKEGIYYTPLEIVTDMLSVIPANIEDKVFLDPCCGGGNFIISAIELGFKSENVYGFDTDENAVAITRKRIFDKTGFESNNIIQTDFLEKAKTLPQKFDFIFTNPPWGKKISKDVKERYAIIYRTGKSVDTSSLFFFASLNCLAENGKLGFLLPESFFNISTFQDARNAALKLTIERLIDYAKPFKGLVTKAQAIILSNKVDVNIGIKCELPGQSHLRSTESFYSTPKMIFNFWADEESAEVIAHIYKSNHITLADNAEWGLGIVTGNNEKFCKPHLEEGFMPVYKGSDITKKGLKDPTNFIPDNLSLYQQVAPKELYEASAKLIYKFISSNLCFYFDKEQKYILNSANMLILKKQFPLTGEQLTDLFNSSFINWLFQTIFNTHKVLRGDLELLPIHADYFKTYQIFDETSYLNYLNIEKIQNGTYRIKR